MLFIALLSILYEYFNKSLRNNYLLGLIFVEEKRNKGGNYSIISELKQFLWAIELGY